MYRQIATAFIASLMIGICANAKPAQKEKVLPKPKRMPTSDRFAGNCYDLSPTGIENIDEVLFQLPKDHGKSFSVLVSAFDKNGKTWANFFHCAREADRTIMCRGADDSGIFTLTLQLLDATMKVSSISFGTPEDPGPQILPVAGRGMRKLVLRKVSCE